MSCMKRNELIERVKELSFDYDKFWLVAGGAMVLYGFREETADVDLGCTSDLADELQDKGYPTYLLDDGTRKITFSDDVEIFEDWIKGSVEYHDDIPVVSVNGLIEMKRELGREKDLRDIELILSHLKEDSGEVNHV